MPYQVLLFSTFPVQTKSQTTLQTKFSSGSSLLPLNNMYSLGPSLPKSKQQSLLRVTQPISSKESETNSARAKASHAARNRAKPNRTQEEKTDHLLGEAAGRARPPEHSERTAAACWLLHTGCAVSSSFHELLSLVRAGLW